MSEPFADVDALFDALRASRDADDEGGLSILEHCLQCAELLRISRAGDDALQVAGLVHDLGWLERSGDGAVHLFERGPAHRISIALSVAS